MRNMEFFKNYFLFSHAMFCSRGILTRSQGDREGGECLKVVSDSGDKGLFKILTVTPIFRKLSGKEKLSEY